MPVPSGFSSVRARKLSPSTVLLGRLADLGTPGRAVGPTADVLRSEGLRAAVEWRRSKGGPDWTEAARDRVYREIWDDAISYHGLEHVELAGGFLLIGSPGRQTLVRDRNVMLDYDVTIQLALDKAAVHSLLAAEGIPMARSREFDAGDPARGLDFLAGTEGACVVKPRGSAGGDAVTCGVRTDEHFERARLWARRRHSSLIIEEQAEGFEFRFLFLDGDLLDVLARRPPEVIGDGRSTVAELIAGENRRRAGRRGEIAVLPLGVDLDCLLTLERNGLSLRSVPASGTTVVVKTSTNQSAAEQVQTVPLDAVGGSLTTDARAAAHATGLRFAAVELITSDPMSSLRDAGGVVVEVNGTPGLHYHYLVADTERHVPVARPLLKVLLDPARTRTFPPFPVV